MKIEACYAYPRTSYEWLCPSERWHSVRKAIVFSVRNSKCLPGSKHFSLAGMLPTNLENGVDSVLSSLDSQDNTFPHLNLPYVEAYLFISSGLWGRSGWIEARFAGYGKTQAAAVGRECISCIAVGRRFSNVSTILSTSFPGEIEINVKIKWKLIK